MLRTSDSRDYRWRYAEIEVRADDPASGAILQEINLLLAARGTFEEYLDFVSANTGDASESLEKATERLRALKRKIPSSGELRSQSWPVDPAGAITWYYRKRYAEYPSPCTDETSRPMALSNVATLLEETSKWQTRFREAVGAQHRAEHDRLYGVMVSSFEAWTTIARPLVVPSLLSLRGRESGGRLSRGSRAAGEAGGAGEDEGSTTLPFDQQACLATRDICGLLAELGRLC